MMKKTSKGNRIVAAFITILLVILLGGCNANSNNSSNSDDNSNYDLSLIQKGQEAIDDFGLLPNRTYEVTYNNVSRVYSANINGNIQQVQIPEHTPSSSVISDEENLEDSHIQKIFESSKKKVLDYIESSTILQDKSKLVSEFDTLNLKFAKINLSLEHSDEHAPALYQSHTIYVDENYKEDVCEWLFVHEMIHFLCELTNDGVENEVYGFYLFNEVMTDLLTSTLSPEISKGNITGYMPYYEMVLPYIGAFGEKAIEAYFYGYNDIWEIVGKDEFDFYIYSLENYDCSETAEVCVNNFLNKWGLAHPVNNK